MTYVCASSFCRRHGGNWAVLSLVCPGSYAVIDLENHADNLRREQHLLPFTNQGLEDVLLLLGVLPQMLADTLMVQFQDSHHPAIERHPAIVVQIPALHLN